MKLSRPQSLAIRIASFFILSPLLFAPLKFCPYSIPFFYCPVCHIGCIQGRFRWWILLGILLINLKRNFYCTLLCPCGTVQDWLNRTRIAKLRIHTRLPKYFIFAGIISALILGRRTLQLAVYGKFFLYAAGFIILLSVIIPRSWCRFFCPVDTLNSMLTGAITLLKKISQRAGKPTP